MLCFLSFCPGSNRLGLAAAFKKFILTLMNDLTKDNNVFRAAIGFAGSANYNLDYYLRGGG